MSLSQKKIAKIVKDTAKKNKPKPRGIKKKDEVLLELNGEISIVEKKNGKEVAREVIDGKLVLQCVLNALSRGLDLMEEKLDNK